MNDAVSDIDPLKKADVLLARYRSADTGSHSIDFPVLTEVVDSLQPPENKEVLHELAQTERIAPAAMAQDQLANLAIQLLVPLQTRLEEHFARTLSSTVASCIRPALDEFIERIAGEIAASVSQEVSRQLSEAVATEASRGELNAASSNGNRDS